MTGQLAANGPSFRLLAARTEQRTLDDLLTEAGARVERLDPAAAYAACQNGALLIDLRSDTDRERDGIVSGSLHIPRTVLEWRVCVDSPFRNPYASGLGEQIILLCDHGCASVLAAATLVDLGFERAGDVVGGYAAWREAGLPTRQVETSRRQPGESAGMKPPDR